MVYVRRRGRHALHYGRERYHGHFRESNDTGYELCLPLLKGGVPILLVKPAFFCPTREIVVFSELAYFFLYEFLHINESRVSTLRQISLTYELSCTVSPPSCRALENHAPHHAGCDCQSSYNRHTDQTFLCNPVIDETLQTARLHVLRFDLHERLVIATGLGVVAQLVVA